MLRIAGVLFLLLGVALASWIGYNFFIERQPQTQKVSPFLALLVCLGLFLAGGTWVQGKSIAGKRYDVTHGDNRIVLKNSFFSMSLLINDTCVDSSKAVAVSQDKPVLRGTLTNGDGSQSTVEAFCKQGVMSVAFKIHIDGQWVGGERF